MTLQISNYNLPNAVVSQLALSEIKTARYHSYTEAQYGAARGHRESHAERLQIEQTVIFYIHRLKFILQFQLTFPKIFIKFF